MMMIVIVIIILQVAQYIRSSDQRNISLGCKMSHGATPQKHNIT